MCANKSNVLSLAAIAGHVEKVSWDKIEGSPGYVLLARGLIRKMGGKVDRRVHLA